MDVENAILMFMNFMVIEEDSDDEDLEQFNAIFSNHLCNIRRRPRIQTYIEDCVHR